MTVVAIDCESWLIEPGLLAPPLVCLQWQRQGDDPQLVTHREARPVIEKLLRGSDVLVGHNIAFDAGVLGAAFPDLLPLIFAKYDRDEICDSMIREQLVMISRGQFRSYEGPDGELKAVKYSLADCVARHFGRHLQKEDTWRLRYRELHDVALADWPEDAKHYAIEDARVTLALYESQINVAHADVFRDQWRQARAAFALHLSSAWGICTDPEAVDALEARLTAEFEELQRELQNEGLIRDNGTADTKAAQAAMTRACEEEGLPIAKTKGGAVSLSSEACDRLDEDSVIGQYSRYLTLRKTLANDVKMLRSGCEVPIQPRYGLADTGRTTASKPALQAINRGAGIREAFRPRPGNCFIQADFEGLELHTLAQWCITNIGYSKLGEALNEGKDVHLLTAATQLGMTYEDAEVEKGKGSKAVKEYRQRAKAINFGLPGGLGAKGLARYARVAYRVNMSEQEAMAAKQAWLALYPEMNEHFRLAALATNNFAKVGTETHIFSGRVRGGARYSALCNGRFQGLGADAAKNALWLVTKACYVDVNSPLYGWRVVAFVHDELIAEGPMGDCDAAAREMSRLMCEGANVFVHDCPVEAPPVAMMLWSKGAYAVTDDQGRLVPWAPEAPKKAA